jgi:hypothetical protein
VQVRGGDGKHYYHYYQYQTYGEGDEQRASGSSAA